MRYKFAILLALGLILSSCGRRPVTRVNDLENLTSQRLLELGADRYVNYDYDGATYYYENLIELFPEDHINVAWARYELGYINYQRKRPQQAIEYFTRVLQTPVDDMPGVTGSQASAPHRLASMMIENINYKPPRIRISAETEIGEDDTLEAGERASIKLNIENSGKGPARNLRIIIDKRRGADEIVYTIPSIEDIPANSSREITIPLIGRDTLKKGTAVLLITVKERESDHSSNTARLKFRTMASEK